MRVEDKVMRRVVVAISRSAHAWRVPLALAGLLGALALQAQNAAAQLAGTAVYVRADTDKTTVIAPRLHVATPVGETTDVDLVYSMDIWTSASIDIAASASKAITEQRDELDVHVNHEFDALGVKAGYRFSKEPDYESHGATLGISRDFADKNSTLALDATGTFDTVGRAGDPGFARPMRVLSGRTSFTQVLDRSTLLQLIYELSQAQGFLSSPYRFVGIQTEHAFCNRLAAGASPYCLPETNPNLRLKHAAALRLQRALGEHFSVGASYRFYLDDWNVMSHTATGELSFLPGAQTLLALRYRFYTQTAASQYKSYYDRADLKFYTNDKKLSPMSSHRIALDLEQAFALDDPSKKLRAVLSIAPTFYQYSDFAIRQITALEVTLSTVFQP
jgi:hypothetical protein